MTLEFWRDLSVVWISIYLFLLCLVPLGIAFLAVQGMNRALGKAADGFQRLQSVSGRVRDRTEETATRVATVVMQGQSKATRAQATIKQLLRGDP